MPDKETTLLVTGMPLSACGEPAGYTAHIHALPQCGIRTLSVAPPLIPTVKEAIRESWCNKDLMPE